MGSGEQASRCPASRHQSRDRRPRRVHRPRPHNNLPAGIVLPVPRLSGGRKSDSGRPDANRGAGLNPVTAGGLVISAENVREPLLDGIAPGDLRAMSLPNTSMQRPPSKPSFGTGRSPRNAGRPVPRPASRCLGPLHGIDLTGIGWVIAGASPVPGTGQWGWPGRGASVTHVRTQTCRSSSSFSGERGRRKPPASYAERSCGSWRQRRCSPRVLNVGILR